MTARITHAERIREALSRGGRALEHRPALGQRTAVTRVRLGDALRCEISEGSWTLPADVGPKLGGDGSAPNPGLLLRGAVGACLAMGCAMWAARRGVRLDRLEVTVEADYDARGELAVAPVPPGYTAMRCAIDVASEASDAELEEIFALAEAHSSLEDVLVRPVSVTRTVKRMAEVANEP